MTLLTDSKTEDVSDQTKKIQQKISAIVSKLFRGYVDFISNMFVSTTIVLIWFVFIGFAVLGLCRLHVELRPSKFFLKDSPMLRLNEIRNEKVVPYYTPVTVVVNNPGDLSNDSTIEKLNEMRIRLENMPGAIGNESTKFFVNDFVQFRNDLSEEFDDDNMDIETFLNWSEYRFWRGFVKIDNSTNPKTVSKFMFTTGFHGAELKDWLNRGELLKSWRATLEDFKDDFNATVFSEDGFFLDMLDTIPTITWQTTLATFVFVCLVCFLFIADLFTVAVVSIAILVTSIGVFGYLSLFGVTLDPVIMSIAIMCIGFSVDIPAHVTFHFYAASSKHGRSHHQPSHITVSDLVETPKKPTPSEQENAMFRKNLTFALSSVGFPVIQAGLSTDFCALPLGFMELYMAKMFAASLTLCVTFSLIHGLVVIPALLSVKSHFMTRIRTWF